MWGREHWFPWLHHSQITSIKRGLDKRSVVQPSSRLLVLRQHKGPDLGYHRKKLRNHLSNFTLRGEVSLKGFMKEACSLLLSHLWPWEGRISLEP